MQIKLDGEWTLSYKDNLSQDSGCITALVPGNIELDFIRAELLPQDIFKGMNITLAEKYETYDFVYEREFTCPDTSKNYRMTFLGVDTLAEYFINGESIGKSENMLVEHTFVLPPLKEKNTLTVKISSCYLASLNKNYTVRMLNAWDRNEAPFFRRAAHTYGWDIMPRAVSAGIWKSVILEQIPEYEFSQFYLMTSEANEDNAELTGIFVIDSVSPFRKSDDYTLEVVGKCEESEFFFSKKLSFKAGKISFSVPRPKLWNTVGFGSPYLYEVKVTLYKCGQPVAEHQTRTGIRTIRLIRTEETDGKNGCFKFVLNGVEIFARGTNWVPMSPYHSEDEKRLPRALEALSDIGCNMVRCWGGNVYENDLFYDYCDSHGIMVWQDFGFGCASYCKERKFLDEVKIEAEKVIKRLRHHACLALWAGDNEIDEMLSLVGVEPSTNEISRVVLPSVVSEHDTYRAYLPSSPFVKSLDAFNRGAKPEDHLWGSRDFFKADFYTKYNAHFVSEIGYHGAVSKESALKFIDESELNNRHGEQWILHSTDCYGDDGRVYLMEKQIGFMFGKVPSEYEEFAQASLMVQSEAYKHFIENIRAQKGVKSGILWWNLIDGWPQFADSMIDYYYERKPAYYTVKRTQARFTMLITEGDNERYNLYAVNDTNQKTQFKYKVTCYDTNEQLLVGESSVCENGIKKLSVVPETWSKRQLLIIEWETSEQKGFNYFITGSPEYELETVKKWYEVISKKDSEK